MKPEKRIRYDRLTKDFAIWYGTVLVGYAATYREAEAALDAYVYELLRRQPAQEAA